MNSTVTPPRVVVYLQSQSNLATLPASYANLTAINLSSFHFGYNPDNTPYIHLNDNDPDYPPFLKTVWPAMKQAQLAGVKVIAMLGGAGGAYTTLFANYDTFYPMWVKFLRTYGLDGVDLDVEEPVSQANIQMLISDLRRDFPTNFYITSAPVAYALSSGNDPLSGIDWAPLASSLDWFNVQFYSGYGSLRTTADYESIIAQGYSPAQILGGALTNRSNGSGYVPIATVCQTLASLAAKYPGQFGGAMGWEQFNANNTNEVIDPPGWCAAMNVAVHGATPTIFTVQSTQPWQSTSVNVASGKTVTITYVEGLWTSNPNDNGGQLFNAAGNPNYVATQPGYTMIGQNEGSLIGRVESNPVFYVGNGPTTVPAGQTGALSLCINDDLQGQYGAGLSDNQGSVTVVIAVT